MNKILKEMRGFKERFGLRALPRASQQYGPIILFRNLYNSIDACLVVKMTGGTVIAGLTTAGR